MLRINIKQTGKHEIERKYREFAKKTRKNVADEVWEAAKECWEFIVNTAPVDTGALRANIELESYGALGARIVAYSPGRDNPNWQGRAVPYQIYIDEGRARFPEAIQRVHPYPETYFYFFTIGKEIYRKKIPERIFKRIKFALLKRAKKGG